MAFIDPSTWDTYKGVINEFHEDANQQEVIWRRITSNRSRYQEGTNTTEDITILALVQYNYFRSWPINRVKEAGELDQESMMLFLNVQYLRDQGHMTADDQFNFNPSEDRFIIEGVVYKPTGDTKVAQASDDPLMLTIILKREETSTGDNIYE